MESKEDGAMKCPSPLSSQLSEDTSLMEEEAEELKAVSVQVKH